MSLTIVLLALLLSIAGHALLCRSHLIANLVIKFLAVGMPIGLVLAIYLFVEYGLNVESISILFLYAFACELYIFLFTFIISSVSVRLLLTLRLADLTRIEIEEIFVSKNMVSNRLNTLVTNGFLSKEQTNYILTTKGAFLIKLFDSIRALFHPYLYNSK